MKKIACFSMSVACMLTMVGCQKVTYEEELFKEAEVERTYFDASVEEFFEDGINLNIEVNQVSKDIYDVTLFGDTQQKDFTANDYIEEDIQDISEIDETTEKTVKSVRSNVISYINVSSVIKDKDPAIEQINSVEVKFAEIEGNAIYHTNVIYINKDTSEAACEYAITYGYILALRDYTNGGADNVMYKGTRFDKTLTDIICRQLSQQNSNNEHVSDYSDYYYYILVYLDCFKEDALNAYFYGYDSIWENTERDDFDFFVQIFDGVLQDTYSYICYIASIYRWQQLAK